MRPLQTVLGIFALAAALLLGCTKTEVQPEKVEAVEEPNIKTENTTESPQIQPKKILSEDMYVERARKHINHKNMDSEMNRIEKELNLMERELEAGERRLNKSEGKTP
jgi:vacuolar-type H+-ATPase subunit D/Vma8